LEYQEFYQRDENGVWYESCKRAKCIIVVFINGAHVIILAYLSLGNSFLFLRWNILFKHSHFTFFSELLITKTAKCPIDDRAPFHIVISSTIYSKFIWSEVFRPSVKGLTLISWFISAAYKIILVHFEFKMIKIRLNPVTT